MFCEYDWNIHAIIQMFYIMYLTKIDIEIWNFCIMIHLNNIQFKDNECFGFHNEFFILEILKDDNSIDNKN